MTKLTYVLSLMVAFAAAAPLASANDDKAAATPAAEHATPAAEHDGEHAEHEEGAEHAEHDKK